MCRIYRNMNINILVYKNTSMQNRGCEAMGLELLENNTYESKKDYIYRMIRKNIIDINLKPGEVISENDIANAFETSRTPIREAFTRLANEELIEIYPQKGTFVSLIDIKRAQEAKFMRVNLEKEIVRQACREFPDDILFQLEANINQQEFCVMKENYITIFDLDNEMHELIYRGCKMDRIWSAIRFISGDYDRIRTLRLSSDTDWNAIIDDHKQLIKAIKDKDEERGLKIISDHLTMIDRDVILLKEKYPEYFKQ
ncbi:transcriptional regulator, GntR family [Thermoanaerobacterium thermosaccharolyticum DSM 571]|uniref:Transcriptional regulator, GntR family n=2 Tax=Thermoanaerobacterium thermosaccharolyticum TaxID=1517 RepID=D9TMY1_THETC|nr:transcriptional regulator, GntR family [Thermoanaerobacterium thermosaccharolyticum DSM 571]